MALNFNGSSQYGRFPNQTDANSFFNQSAAFSIAVRFKPTGGSSLSHVMGTDAGSGSGYSRQTGIAFRPDVSNTVSFYWGVGYGYVNLTTISLDGWHLVIVTKPAGGSTAITAAIDSVDTTGSGAWCSRDYEAHGFAIGAAMNASSALVNFFTGKIAEFAIWKGRQLSAAEIDSLQGGARLNTISTGLTEYVDLLANTSGVATTLTSSSGKVMTFTGSPTFDADSPYITASVTDVNTNEVVVSGGAVSITTSAIPSATGATIGGKALTSFSGSNDAYSGNMPSMVDGQTYPAYGTQSCIIINGTNNPSLSVTLNLAATDTYTTVAGVSTAFGTVAYEAGLVGLTISNGDTLTYKLPESLGVANNLINPDTSIETDVEGVQIVYHRNNSTGMVTQLNITTGSGASGGTVVKLTRKISGNMISSNKLTANTL